VESPARPKSQLAAETFGQSAEFYDYSPFFPMAGKRIVDLAEIPVGARLLDVATGTGAVLFPAAERVGVNGRVIGIDLAEPMVARTAAEISRRGIAQAEVRNMNAEALLFEDSAFDRVTCGFALWFIPDLQSALREMHRVLRPGGRLTVSTWGPPNDLSSEHNKLLEAYCGKAPALNSRSLTSADAVRTVLRAAGFEVTYAAEETISAVFADEEQWWSQRMACPQLYTHALAPQDQQRFKSDVVQMLQPFKASDGIQETRTAVFAVAAKPSC
jgi:ubiquinone/menaquinone biosynthesis C-methylase UbiE